MKSKNNELIENHLNEIFPNAGCELIYHKDYEFLIAVMLSAQCTDKKVNAVTEVLFSKYQSLEHLNASPLEDIENILKPLGLYKNKAKNLKGIVNDILNRFNGNVPIEKEELVTLPGVGNKTASVYRAEILHLNEFPVDTHVARISKRLGLAKEEDSVEVIETKLKKNFNEGKWVKLHHQFIHFGRYKCKAIKPDCKDCKLAKICKNPLKVHYF